MCESQVNPGDEDVPIFSEEWSNEDEDNRIVILKAEICKKDAQLNELSRCLNEAQQSCKEWERTARSYETIIKQAEERVDVMQAKIEPKTITPSDAGKLEVATMTEEMMKPTLTLTYDEAPNLGNLEILLKNKFCESALSLLQELSPCHIKTLRRILQRDEGTNFKRASKILDILEEFVVNEMPSNNNQKMLGERSDEQEGKVTMSHVCSVQGPRNMIRSETQKREFEERNENYAQKCPLKNEDMVKKVESLEIKPQVKQSGETFDEGKSDSKNEGVKSEEKNEELCNEMQAMDESAFLPVDCEILLEKVDQLSNANEKLLTNEKKQLRQIQALSAELKKYVKAENILVEKNKLYFQLTKQLEKDKEELVEENKRSQPSQLKKQCSEYNKLLSKKNQQLLMENEQHLNDIRQLSVEKDTLVQTNKELRNNCQNLAREKEKIMKESNYYISENKQLQNGKNHLLKKSKEMLKEMRKVTDEKKQVQKENKQHLREIEELRSENGNFSRACKQLSKENQQHLRDKEQLSQEKRQNSIEKEQLSLDQQQLIKLREQIRSEKEQHSKDKDELAHEKDQLAREKDELAKEKDLFYEEKEMFFIEKRQSSQQNEQELMNINEQLQKEKEHLLGKNRRLKMKCDELFKQIQRQIRKLQELESLSVNRCNYLVDELDWSHREDCHRKDNQIDIYLKIIGNLYRKLDVLLQRSDNPGVPEL